MRSRDNSISQIHSSCRRGVTAGGDGEAPSRSASADREGQLSGEKEFMLNSLRGAILRAKLDINQFESIGIALRADMISPDGAIEWLHGAGLITQVLEHVGEEGQHHDPT